MRDKALANSEIISTLAHFRMGLGRAWLLCVGYCLAGFCVARCVVIADHIWAAKLGDRCNDSRFDSSR